MFLEKGIMKICSKRTGEHPTQSVNSVKLLRNFIEITLWHGYSPVNLMHIFCTPSHNNYYGGPNMKGKLVVIKLKDNNYTG